MKKKFMEEILIKVADLPSLSKRTDAAPTVLADKELIFADVVFESSYEYFRAAHRDGKQARSFGAIDTAVNTLTKAGFNDVVIKQLDSPRPPEWIHANDNEVIAWEEELDQMGIDAAIEKLIKHKDKAPTDAPSLPFLTAFIEGYKKALQKN